MGGQLARVPMTVGRASRRAKRLAIYGALSRRIRALDVQPEPGGRHTRGEGSNAAPTDPGNASAPDAPRFSPHPHGQRRDLDP
jgi:hypothetical protein